MGAVARTQSKPPSIILLVSQSNRDVAHIHIERASAANRTKREMALGEHFKANGLALFLTGPFLRSLTHEHGVFSAYYDAQEDGIVWKRTVWSERMSDRMFFNGLLRSNIVICIPQDTCRYCGDARAKHLLRGWWIEDEPPNDTSMQTPSFHADVEKMLRVEWPAFAESIYLKCFPV